MVPCLNIYNHLFTSIKKGNHNRNYSKDCNSKEAFSLLIMGLWKIDMWVGGGGGGGGGGAKFHISIFCIFNFFCN